MCGFAGFTSKLENKAEYLKKMTDRIVHRGPDMDGEYISPDGEVALGFRRLSIIDLSEAGRQPMVSDDGECAIVFNGEIYNFMSLRADLEAKGHTFKGRSDSEVLLEGYREYKEGIVDRLRGMFAFVIYDRDRNILFGARDFFGIKPFYYTRLTDGGFAFGSEIKSFLDCPGFEKRLNEEAIRPYLTFQYSATEETFFKGVFKLPPAHCFCYDIKSGEMNIRRYWDVDFKSDDVSFEECAEKLDEVINESVRAHRIADVKVGAFLSGGVDSSYITAAMMPDKTFSVGFDYHNFNETNYAAELSDILGIQNYRRMLTADECFDALGDIQYHMDEPQSNPSSIPLYFLARLAAEHVTVVLSGEGADEIYAGYEDYNETPMMRKYKRIPTPLRLAAARAAKKMPYFKGHDFMIKCSGRPEEYFIGQAHVFDENEAKNVLKGIYKNGKTPLEIAAPIYDRVTDRDELIKKQYLDLNLWMPGDILLKADKMSMASSLELRVPFLDREVMAHAQTIPSSYKINGINTKYVLRAAANKTVPDDWANRPKKGFPVPIRYWFAEDKYYNVVAEYFNADFASEFFDTAYLMKLLNDHKVQKANNGRKIYTALTFLIWYKRFFIDEK